MLFNFEDKVHYEGIEVFHGALGRFGIMNWIEGIYDDYALVYEEYAKED